MYQFSILKSLRDELNNFVFYRSKRLFTIVNCGMTSVEKFRETKVHAIEKRLGQGLLKKYDLGRLSKIVDPKEVSVEFSKGLNMTAGTHVTPEKSQDYLISGQQPIDTANFGRKVSMKRKTEEAKSIAPLFDKKRADALNTSDTGMSPMSTRRLMTTDRHLTGDDLHTTERGRTEMIFPTPRSVTLKVNDVDSSEQYSSSSDSQKLPSDEKLIKKLTQGRTSRTD